MQDGVLPAYIAIPLIQQKTQEQKQMQSAQQAQQAQSAQQAPVAQQIMQDAAGISALPSNLPSEGFAGGGIVAFSGADDEGNQAPSYVGQSVYSDFNPLRWLPGLNAIPQSVVDTIEEKRRKLREYYDVSTPQRTPGEKQRIETEAAAVDRKSTRLNSSH